MAERWASSGRSDSLSPVPKREASSGSTPPQYPIESVDNALKVILLLGEQRELRLTEVSEHLGVATSTAHRILAMLVWRGFVRQDSRTKAYGPGPALTTVAFSVLRQMDIPRLAQPILEDIAVSLGETVHLGTLEGASARFLAVAEADAAVRVASRLGRSLPAHSTSTGKVLLAELSDEQFLRLYPEEVLPSVTSRSITSRDELVAELGRIRIAGYATNREESEDGVASVAVAVPVSSGLKLAINASAPVYRLPASKTKSFGRTLRDGALRLSELLG